MDGQDRFAVRLARQRGGDLVARNANALTAFSVMAPLLRRLSKWRWHAQRYAAAGCRVEATLRADREAQADPCWPVRAAHGRCRVGR